MFRFCFVAIILIKYCLCDPTKCDLRSSLVQCGEEVQHVPKASEFENAVVRMLDLRNCSKLKFADDDFDGYEALENLELGHIDMPSQRGEVPLNKFSNLMKLSSLSFTHSGLTDSEMWILPKNLQHYYVDGNEYTRLDVSMCPQITGIYANDNKLENIPTLHDPTPPLVAMYLKNNSMAKLKVKDIASLCDLQILKLEPPPNAFLRTKDGACECKKLQKWFAMFNIKGSGLNCRELPPEIKCDLTCNDIRNLRTNCPDKDRLTDCLTESIRGDYAADQADSSAGGSTHDSTLGLTQISTIISIEISTRYSTQDSSSIEEPSGPWTRTIIPIVFAVAAFMVLIGFAFYVYSFTATYNEGKAADEDYQEERSEERLSYDEEAEEEI